MHDHCVDLLVLSALLLPSHRGWGQFGQLGYGSNGSLSTASGSYVVGIASALEVSCGVHHSCAVLLGGAVKCWGENALGQLGALQLPSSLQS